MDFTRNSALFNVYILRAFFFPGLFTRVATTGHSHHIQCMNLCQFQHDYIAHKIISYNSNGVSLFTACRFVCIFYRTHSILNDSEFIHFRKQRFRAFFFSLQRTQTAFKFRRYGYLEHFTYSLDNIERNRMNNEKGHYGSMKRPFGRTQFSSINLCYASLFRTEVSSRFKCEKRPKMTEYTFDCRRQVPITGK